MPTASNFRDLFPFDPTPSQEQWFLAMDRFLKESSASVFILKGYAGTGKTTLMGFLVRYLRQLQMRSVLMAPTGRAAKVLSAHTQKKAYTIHKHIYFPKKNKVGGMQFRLKTNKFKKTLFIVDEASMIGDDRKQVKLFENGSLLHDLWSYVHAGENCKLLLVGDPAQLPPVFLEISPALDANEVRLLSGETPAGMELVEVVRQQQASGILVNATHIRERIQSQFYDSFQFHLDGFLDIIRIQDGNELLELLDTALHSSLDEAVVVVRSNKRANLYNANIRQRILFLESQLAVGDQLMVVRNNYFWLAPESAPGFIANGDVIQIQQIHEYKEIYDFQFARVTVQMIDYPGEPAFETVLLLDTLSSESPALTQEENQSLYSNVLEDYAHFSSKYKQLLEVKANPYYNALQVKYSYTITCHKAQGGQWNQVFIEQPYLPEGPDLSYFRWLYTALTRAQKKVYLIGFGPEYFQ
ncbi:MAG: ATP-dependent DNA helicase [Flavobacteriaceae bacterium]